MAKLPDSVISLDLSNRARACWIKDLLTACLLLGASATLLAGADLSEYRGFRIGMDLSAVASHAHMQPGQAQLIHQRPALIQALEWRPERSVSPLQPEAVRVVVFSFYNGELFRMVVEYDPVNTEGLTPHDMIQSVSAVYGPSAKPPAPNTTRYSGSYGSGEPAEVLACWQDPDYSLNLVRMSYEQAYALIAISQRVDHLAETAITEAERLDTVERPQREQERVIREAEAQRTKAEKARAVNAPVFRP
jgi:hypothetical protein